MKLDSKYFDMIRIRRPAQPEPQRPTGAEGLPLCQWKGCALPGLHRAPKGRRREREYYLFCAEHIRQYNSSYNYFDGMSDGEVEEFHRDAVYGHRPTWKVGENPSAAGNANGATTEPFRRFAAGREAQRFHAWRARQQRGEREPERRKLRPLERKSLETLGLAEATDKAQIKARFKELVKRHHPDSNGGDRACEDRLREIIQAYNYLKQVGLA